MYFCKVHIVIVTVTRWNNIDNGFVCKNSQQVRCGSGAIAPSRVARTVITQAASLYISTCTTTNNRKITSHHSIYSNNNFSSYQTYNSVTSSNCNRTRKDFHHSSVIVNWTLDQNRTSDLGMMTFWSDVYETQAKIQEIYAVEIFLALQTTVSLTGRLVLSSESISRRIYSSIIE